MDDPLHVYNIDVSAARKAHRSAIRTAASIYATAHADLMVAHELRLANAARTFREALATAESVYDTAMAPGTSEPPF